MKKGKGTHQSMGTVKGATAGVESGLASVEGFKPSSPKTETHTDRPKARNLGSVATK